MASSNYPTPAAMQSVDIWMVGFEKDTFSPSCCSVLTSVESFASVNWVGTVDEVTSRDNAYDVVVMDCRTDSSTWGRAHQLKRNRESMMILGITDGSTAEAGLVRPVDDPTGILVSEGLAPVVMQLTFQQAQERNQLIAERTDLHHRLSDAAYKTEMAQIASTVLHNVGNVLTSVTVAANLMESTIGQSAVTLVNRMAKLMKEHDKDLGTFLTQDPKGQRIPQSLEKLGNHLIEEQQTILREIEGLVRNLHHMKQVIVSHQMMGKSAGQVEPLSITDALSHAIELSFQPGDEKWMTVYRDVRPVAQVLADRHQLLQVLVNILRNAKQAMRQQPAKHHELHLSVTDQDLNETFVIMTIRDSGIGIAPEHLSNMFTRGFTTKEDGNGIGLHSSLDAIQNMGGSLEVHSDGIGKGATFSLKLPVAR